MKVFVSIRSLLKEAGFYTFFVFILAIAEFFPTGTISGELPGGSNYAWYYISGCVRDPFLVIGNVKAKRELILSQLSEMYKGGQRRLRLPLYYYHNAPQGYVSSSFDGLNIADLNEIRELVGIIKSVGFEEVLFGFFPQGPNRPFDARWTQGLEEENWTVIKQVRNVLSSAELPYRLDLFNEGIPQRSQTALFQYVKRLWARYIHNFGLDDTVGFSLIADPARVSTMREVYAGTFPKAIDVHVYNDPPASILNVAAGVASQGMGGIPWIIGETFYDDPDTVEQIRAAARRNHVEISFILQWPIHKHRACADVDVIPLNLPRALSHPPP